MNSLFDWNEVMGNSNAIYAELQRETCLLIEKYCQIFGLDEHTEFTCFELMDMHLKNVQRNILDGFQDVSGSSSDQSSLNEYMQQATLAIDIDLPLNLFSIISITAKYFGSKTWIEKYFKMLPKVLQETGKTVSFKDWYHSEFKVFRDLDFCIKRSGPYQCVQTLLEYASINISSSFSHLQTVCIAILRFAYIERQTIYKKVQASIVAKGYMVNTAFIASAVVLAAAEYEKFDEMLAEDLLELIKVRTGFSDYILRNFTHAILSEFKKKEKQMPSGPHSGSTQKSRLQSSVYETV